MLVLRRAEVEALLDLDRLIDALSAALAELSAGRAETAPRTAALVPERGGALIAMPGYAPSARALTAKLVTLFPRNAGGPRPTHQGLIAAFDPEDGTPVALLDGEAITAARTAAGSALATRLLARKDAGVLAIIGTGVQAQAHARAVVRVRPFREVRIAGRDPARATALALALARDRGLPVTAAGSYAEALDGADVVCATTHAAEPVVRRAWLGVGVHVNAVGYNPAGSEVDTETVAGARPLAVESRAAALAPFPVGAADLGAAVEAGVLEPRDVAEVGEIVAGTHPGRTDPAALTLYRSVGLALQDAVATALVLDEARRRGAGTHLPL